MAKSAAGDAAVFAASFDKLQTVAHKGLRGLKIAPFYGCQILRPSKLMGFEDPDKPSSLERIIEACGGEAIDYPAKIKCCGFPIIQAREDTALAELIQPIEQAMEAGADAMVTPCPLCHLSLDAWQSKLKKQTGRDFAMPILHLSQLVGVAAGLTESPVMPLADTLDGFADCDLVIETAVEKEEVKRKIFHDVCAVLKPEAIIASDTSSISITRLAASGKICTECNNSIGFI